MNVSLEPKLQEFIETEVRAGRFSSPDHVINAAVANLQTERQSDQNLSAEELPQRRAELAIGIDQADRGDVAPWDPDEIMAEVERRFGEENKSR